MHLTLTFAFIFQQVHLFQTLVFLHRFPSWKMSHLPFPVFFFFFLNTDLFLASSKWPLFYELLPISVSYWIKNVNSIILVWKHFVFSIIFLFDLRLFNMNKERLFKTTLNVDYIFFQLLSSKTPIQYKQIYF